LETGRVKVWDIGTDGESDPDMKAHPTTRKYQDTVAEPGFYLGESSLIDNLPLRLNATAVEDGIAFVIDKETFRTVLGDLQGLIIKSLDRKKLGAMKLIQQTQLDKPTIRSLSNFVVEKKYKKGRVILNEGQTVEAALYIMRKGKVRIWSRAKNQPEIVDDLGFFGEDQLLADVERGTNGPYDPTTTVAKYTVQALDDVSLGILTLAVCRKCLDTTNFGKPHASILDSLVQRQIPMTELQRHRILGAGTFGQVRVPLLGATGLHAYRLLAFRGLIPALLPL
jgi:CRP-like cAMP-binding protein